MQPMLEVRHLLQIIDAFQLATGLPDVTISSRAFADSKKIAAMRDGAGITVERPAPIGDYKISLAEWSLHKALFANEMTNMDFPKVARERFGFEAVEFVNQFFKDKARDEAYLKDLKGRAADNGVTCVLIMIDGEGDLSAPDKAARMKAVEQHSATRTDPAGRFLRTFENVYPMIFGDLESALRSARRSAGPARPRPGALGARGGGTADRRAARPADGRRPARPGGLRREDHVRRAQPGRVGARARTAR